MIWDDLSEDLQALGAQGLLRRLRVADSPPQPEMDLDGRRVLQFCGNNYLGLSTHPRVLAAAKAALERFGAGSGASPLISGHLRVHAELETALARHKGAEAALVFATGSLANLGCLSALLGPEDQAFLDKRVHATLYDGARLSGAAITRFPHNDLGRLDALLQASRASGGQRLFVVVDAVYSMDGDIAPLPALLQLAERHGATVIVDEAHSTGVLGERGRGILEHFKLAPWPLRLALTGTLSKALGSLGGFVAGPQALVERLVNTSRSYIYATALPAASAAAALEALRVVDEEPQRLQRLRDRVDALNTGLMQAGWLASPSPTPILPLPVGSAEAALGLQARLWDAGIFVPAIRPPTVPAGACRLRISVSSEHSQQHCQRLLQTLGRPQ
jgi:8-amino-7-oxononanoate synthase